MRSWSVTLSAQFHLIPAVSIPGIAVVLNDEGYYWEVLNFSPHEFSNSKVQYQRRGRAVITEL